MNLLGLSITRRKKDSVAAMTPADFGYTASASTGAGWWPLIREPFAGAWQRNQELSQADILSFSTVFSCVTLIASDISKIWVDLVRLSEGVWQPATNPAYSPVLRKPNHYQNRIQFFEQWMISKLLYGNTYVRKVRDNRGVVVDFYILHPVRVKPLIAPNGDVYYDLNADQLSQQISSEVVPASELIHDRFNCLYHPLVGLSPLSACGLAATQGVKIQLNSSRFFNNNSNPGGILTAPHAIGADTAQRIKDHWEANYAGIDNIGKVAVLGDGLTYAPMMISAHDAELVNQLKLSSEMVCTAFHVAPYMVGVGSPPPYANVEPLLQQYYSQCLQVLIESIELCIDEGLGLSAELGIRFDLDSLLRMDTLTSIDAATKAIIGGLKKPNEARRSFDLPPVDGGDAVYLQQQNYSLAALAKRDAADDPFASVRETFTGPATAAPPAPENDPAKPPAKAPTKASKASLARVAAKTKALLLRESDAAA